jgi:hypothetical protein
LLAQKNSTWDKKSITLPSAFINPKYTPSQLYCQYIFESFSLAGGPHMGCPVKPGNDKREGQGKAKKKARKDIKRPGS